MGSLTTIFKINGSAMLAQSKRLNATASNLANIETVPEKGQAPYQAKRIQFKSIPINEEATGVIASKLIQDISSTSKQVYNPSHPSANDKGFVTMPDINPAEEMVDLIDASRSYQTNVEVLNTAKTLIQKTLTIGD